MRYRTGCIMTAVLLAVVLGLPSVGLGQATTQPSGLRTPRNDVKGGSLSANRPGNWIGKATATHIDRQQKAIHQFGGATYKGPEQYPPSRREVFLVSFFQSMFKVLNDMAQQLGLVLQATQTTQPVS